MRQLASSDFHSLLPTGLTISQRRNKIMNPFLTSCPRSKSANFPQTDFEAGRPKGEARVLDGEWPLDA